MSPSVAGRGTNARCLSRRMLAESMRNVSEFLTAPLDELLAEARGLRTGRLATYSPKVFIPLTTLCRDVCGYCTFARPPRRGERAFMSEEEVLAIAAAGAAAGCRRRSSRSATSPSSGTRSRGRNCARSAARRRSSTSRAAQELVLEETGLLPHLNPGVMTRTELEARSGRYRPRWGSCSRRPPSGSVPRGPHWASPDKVLRVASRRSGSRASFASRSRRDPHRIGETREERIDAARAQGARRGARACAGSHRPELPREAGDAHGLASGAVLDDHLWTIAGRTDPARPDVARAGAAEPRLRRLPACSTRGSTTGAASRR